MDWESVASGASLAMDAFAVSLCIGASISDRLGNAALRMGMACGLFQFFMPMAGWIAGGCSARLMAAMDHWVAFGLLGFVGGGMIRSAFVPSEFCEGDALISLRSLLSLALATSIDAFVVGAGFALIQKPVFPLSLFAGAFTFLACSIGIYLGRVVGNRFSKRVELLGGVLLILIGLNILISHLLDHGGLNWMKRTASADARPVLEREA